MPVRRCAPADTPLLLLPSHDRRELIQECARAAYVLGAPLMLLGRNKDGSVKTCDEVCRLVDPLIATLIPDPCPDRYRVSELLINGGRDWWSGHTLAIVDGHCVDVYGGMTYAEHEALRIAIGCLL